MPVSCPELSALLEENMDLQLQPVALTFVNDQPADVPRLEAVVPSSCAIWRLAETEVFYAAASDHFNCPLGAMVMGFDLPDAQTSSLQEELGMMCGIDYVREAELAYVPKVPQAPQAISGIVYGPLWRFPLQPDLVLLWMTPQQSMIMSECCGLINWSAAPSGLLGRPGCGALAVAVLEGRPAQSLGCVGMRTNTGVSGNLLLMAVPRNMLDNMHADLAKVAQVHQQMESHYLQRIADLESAKE